MDEIQKMNTELGKLPDDRVFLHGGQIKWRVDKLDGIDYLDTQVEEVMMDLIQSLEERKDD